MYLTSLKHTKNCSN